MSNIHNSYTEKQFKTDLLSGAGLSAMINAKNSDRLKKPIITITGKELRGKKQS